MTAVDVAERKGALRAMFFYALAAALITLLIISFDKGPDFANGLWLGLVVGALINLAPLARWLKPDSVVASLLDDESVREHRRIATTAGFWAAMVSSLAMTVVGARFETIAAYDAVRVIATATVSAALISFATLELRAAR